MQDDLADAADRPPPEPPPGEPREMKVYTKGVENTFAFSAVPQVRPVEPDPPKELASFAPESALPSTLAQQMGASSKPVGEPTVSVEKANDHEGSERPTS